MRFALRQALQLHAGRSWDGRVPTPGFVFAGADAGSGAVVTTLDRGIGSNSFARATVATTVKGDGTIAQVSSGVARSAYDGAGNFLGLAIEDARTNIALWNRDLTNAVWTKGQVTVTLAGTAPDGGSASRIAEMVTSAEHVAYQTLTTTAVPWTFWMLLKQFGTTRPYARLRVDDGSNTNAVQANFNLNTGALGQAVSATGTYASASSKITALNNGWYFCEVTVTPSAVATTRFIWYPMDSDYATNVFTGNTAHTGDTSAGMDCWMAQAEIGGFRSSGIPTTSSSVTRNSEVFTFPTSGNALGTSGCCAAEATWATATGGCDIVSMHNSAGGGIPITEGVSGGITMFDGTSTRVTGPATPAAVTTPQKIVSMWSGSSCNAYVNNVAGTPQTFDGDMSFDSIIQMMGRPTGGSFPYGAIKKARIWQKFTPNVNQVAMISR